MTGALKILSDTSIRPTLAVREADMFHKQARFWVGEFDGEKECAADSEVSAITRHRIFVCGLGVGEGMVCCFKV